MKKVKILFSVIVLTFILTSAFTQSTDKKDKDKDKDKKEEPFKSISQVTKSCKKKDGLFTVFQDTITAKLYLQIAADQLNKEFIHFFHVENGAINAGWVKGSYGWETIFKIRRFFDKIEFVGQNAGFYFDPDNPLARTADANINQPIIAVQKITGMNKAKDTLLIEANDLFLSETFPQLTFAFPPGRGPKNPFKKGSLSSSKTRVEKVKNYPNNTDIIVNYVYENSSPTNYGLPTITDARYTTIQLQHSFVAMPDNDYQIRRDDPRVGYFQTQVTDQTVDSPTPYRDIIHRWHLQKKNPEEAISEPVEPIVFWMENTTPTELRPIIKKGVEAWNIAFEKAGFKNAVVVKQQPDDADWDAGDLRYNVLRWTAAPYMGSAWGPSFINPRTGQILGADIMLDWVFVRGTNMVNKLYNSSSTSLEEMISDDNLHAHTGHHMDHRYCFANEGAKEKINFGRSVSRALSFTENEKDRMIEETIIELLLHEVGHTLGLSHNFRSSQIWDINQVHDRSLTEKKGLTGSVMDYNPLNLTMDRSKQGNYQSLVPGPYDIWAIQYSYTPSLSDPMEEKKRVEKLLSKSTDPLLTFGNDADAHRAPGMGIDPTINTWDMSSDAISYGIERVKLCQGAMNKIMDNLTDDGKSYQELVHGYNSLMWNQFRPLNIIVRYIGGVKVNRDFKGQKNASKPFEPIALADQKRAMNAVVQYGFGPNAFSAPKELYNYLQYQRRGWNHWGNTEDPKLLERVGYFQRVLLAHILHPTVQSRMTNTQMYGNNYSVSEMLGDATNGIFKADLGGNASPIRRNLQIMYTEGLINAMDNSSYNSISKAAMLHEIKNIQEMMKKNKGKDRETKGHRAYISHLIDKFVDE